MGKPIYLQVRLPSALHAMIKASAEEQKRSLNSEIIWALMSYLSREK
jgi:predicted HicB family RNase H-like nuclease